MTTEHLSHFTHEAFDCTTDNYVPWTAGYVAAQSNYPHGTISHEKASRAAGESPWSDEVLLLGRSRRQPDPVARQEIFKALVGYGLAEQGSAADLEDINDFIAGARQGESDLIDGVRL